MDDDRPRISVYIANLARYNEGLLQGGWLDLPVSGVELSRFLKDTVGLDGRQYEEYAIHDAENNLGLRIEEYENLADLNLFAGVLGKAYEHDPLVAEKIVAAVAADENPGWLGLANWAMQTDEIPFYSYDVPSDVSVDSLDERYAYTLVSSGAAGELQTLLDGPYGAYFDLEAWGRDAAMDVHLFENGYYDPQEDMPDAELYDRRELEEYAGLDVDDAHPFRLDSLLEENESIADYTLVGTGTNYGSPVYQCIIGEGSTDISAALEDTLNRIIADRATAGLDDEEEVIRETMGAERYDDVSDVESGSIIDRGYVLPGAIASFERRSPSPTSLDPADPIGIAMTGTATAGFTL